MLIAGTLPLFSGGPRHGDNVLEAGRDSLNSCDHIELFES